MRITALLSAAIFCAATGAAYAQEAVPESCNDMDIAEVQEELSKATGISEDNKQEATLMIERANDRRQKNLTGECVEALVRAREIIQAGQ